MSDVDDARDAKEDSDESAGWGETLVGRAVSKLARVVSRHNDRLATLEMDRDTARDALVALRTRVKALEDKAP